MVSIYCISELHFGYNIYFILMQDFALRLFASAVQRLQHTSSYICHTLTCILKPALLFTAPSIIPVHMQTHLTCQAAAAHPLLPISGHVYIIHYKAL